ncbi:precorrin-2 dehydrogenase/sirohydrochlorin ferrochelatase family protein [Candidatus Methanoperedens nitratireducens]|uniref:precorrin-2 dehydrogenase n=1 Tax=Candidatus Methanoperedens nitratireducens TaxID=1392998 RepID=A0A284VKN7_9EURY|nr:bifunctional precorrin-2 dehydrogenase/sirohydrochlorin ferrochelatase [Candidatus Methanoperedens nitroreducens]SNQ59793.1 Siroheme synthase [Candidatus Methanoperedens nitroreducens]
MKKFLPLMLDLAGKEVVIFGGGEVGERKASLFCGHGEVTVVSRDFTPRLNQFSEEGKIKLVKVKDLAENEIRRYMKDAFIVIAATNDTLVNESIAQLAGKSGKLINRVDDMGDVIVPSVITRGDVVIGISTLGKSPALSKYIRQRLEGVITSEFADMSRLQNEIREVLKSQVHDQKKRKEILWNIINDSDVWSAISESYEKAYKVALKHIERTGRKT